MMQAPLYKWWAERRVFLQHAAWAGSHYPYPLGLFGLKKIKSGKKIITQTTTKI
jgi:hypothetical protein